MQMNSTTRFAMIVTFLHGIVAVQGIAAQDTTEIGRYIKVTGVGKVSSMPDALELVGIVRGDGELAGDALTQFFAEANETIDRLQSLGIDGMTVSRQGLTVGQTIPGTSATERLLAARSGAPPEPGKVFFSERLDIRIDGIDKFDRDEFLTTMVKIIDAGNEAGLAFGKPKTEIERIRSAPEAGYTLFRLVNTADVQARARELAMQEARANAKELANLAGVTLGRVLSIEAVKTSSYVPSPLRSEPNTSPTREKIEVTAAVRVKFEISADSQ
jgi:uncharacterized protein YggE